MPFPQASCCRGFSQSGFTSGCPSRPSGSQVLDKDALLVERDEDDPMNLLMTILQKLQQEQQNSWNGLG